jgi:hypothetical protein
MQVKNKILVIGIISLFFTVIFLPVQSSTVHTQDIQKSTHHYVEETTATNENLSHTVNIQNHTLLQYSIPWVLTLFPTNVHPQGDSATLRGQLLSRGLAPSCEVWFAWDTKYYFMHSSYRYQTPHKTMSHLGSFSHTLTDLERGKTYHYRAVAYNGEYYDQGVDLAFTPGYPQVSTLQSTNIQQNSALLRGEVHDTGDAPCKVWFVYDTQSQNSYKDYQFSTPKKEINDKGIFTKQITGLKSSTKYFYKAVITNDVGTATGSEKNFTTRYSESNPPYIPRSPVPSNTSSGVTIPPTLRWQGGDPDGDPVLYDIYFSDENPPGLLESQYNDTSYTLDSLNYNTTYYWKIIAFDSSGEFTSGPIWSFTTEKDNTPPDVHIIRPENALYVSDNKIRSFLYRNPVIMGKLTIIAQVFDDQSGIAEIVFYINNGEKQRSTDNSYLWNDKDLGQCTIKVTAYDVAGNTDQDSIVVWKVF